MDLGHGLLPEITTLLVVDGAIVDAGFLRERLLVHLEAPTRYPVGDANGLELVLAARLSSGPGKVIRKFARLLALYPEICRGDAEGSRLVNEHIAGKPIHERARIGMSNEHETEPFGHVFDLDSRCEHVLLQLVGQRRTERGLDVAKQGIVQDQELRVSLHPSVHGDQSGIESLARPAVLERLRQDLIEKPGTLLAREAKLPSLRAVDEQRSVHPLMMPPPQRPREHTRA
jgi:hypothetical protein